MPFTRTFEILSMTEQFTKGWNGSVAAHLSFPYNGFTDADFFATGNYTHTVAITATVNSSYTGFSFGSGASAWADTFKGLHIAFADPNAAWTITETLLQPSGTTLTRVRVLACTLFPWMSDGNSQSVPGFAFTYGCSYNNGVAGIHVTNIKICGVQVTTLTPRVVVIGPATTTITTTTIDLQANGVGSGVNFQFAVLPKQSIKVTYNPKDITNTAITNVPAPKAFIYLGPSFVPDITNFRFVDTVNPSGMDFPDTITSKFIVAVTLPLNGTGIVNLPQRVIYQRWNDASGNQALFNGVESAQRQLRIVLSKENYGGFTWPGSTTLWQKLWQSIAYQGFNETPSPPWRLPADAGCTAVAVSGSAKLIQTVPVVIASASHTGGTTQAVAGGFKLTATTLATFNLNWQSVAGIPSGAVMTSPYRYLRLDINCQIATSIVFTMSDFGNGGTINVVGSTKDYAVALVAGNQTVWIDLMDPIKVNGVLQAPLSTIEDEKLYDISHGSTGRYNGIRGSSGVSTSFANNVITVTNPAFDTSDKTQSKALGYLSGNGVPWRLHNDGKNAVEIPGLLQSFMGVGAIYGMDPTTGLSVTLPAQSPVTASQAQTQGFIDPFDVNGDYIGELDARGMALHWTYSPGQTIGIWPLATMVPVLVTDWWKNPVELTALSNWGSVFAQTIVPASADVAHVDYGFSGQPPLFSLPISDPLNTHHGYAHGTTQYQIGNLQPSASPVLTHYIDTSAVLTIALWNAGASGAAFFVPLWHHSRMGPAKPLGMHVCCDPTGVFHLVFINQGKATHRAYDLRPSLASGYNLTNQASPAGVTVSAVQIAWAPHGTLTVCYQEVGTVRIMQVESPDFGRSWETVPQLIVTGGTNPAFDIDPTTGARYCAAYVGTGWRIFRKDVDGGAWTNLAAIPHNGPAAQSGLRVSSQKDHRLEFVSADAAGVLRIYSSLDRGASWTQEN